MEELLSKSLFMFWTVRKVTLQQPEKPHCDIVHCINHHDVILVIIIRMLHFQCQILFL